MGTSSGRPTSRGREEGKDILNTLGSEVTHLLRGRGAGVTWWSKVIYYCIMSLGPRILQLCVKTTLHETVTVFFFLFVCFPPITVNNSIEYVNCTHVC